MAAIPPQSQDNKKLGGFLLSLLQSAIIGLVTASVIGYGTLQQLDTKFEYARETDTAHSQRIQAAEMTISQHSTQIMQLQTQVGFMSAQLGDLLAGQRQISSQLSQMEKKR